MPKKKCVFEFVPAELRNDKDVCSEAVSKDGRSLEFVPYNLINKEMCLVAVKEWGPALEHVPDHMKDKEVCLAALSQNENQDSFKNFIKTLEENESFGAMKNLFLAQAQEAVQPHVGELHIGRVSCQISS